MQKQNMHASAKTRPLSAFITVLRSDVFSIRFLMSLLLVFVALIYATGFSFNSSAVSLFDYVVSWNNVIPFIAIASGICTAPNIVRDIDTKNYYFQIMRTGKRNYLVLKYISCFIATTLAIAIGYTLFAIVCIANCPGITPYDVGSTSDFLSPFEGFLFSGFPALWFLAVIVANGLCAGCLGCIGALCASLSPSQYVAAIMPFVIMFFWSKICIQLQFTNWINLEMLMKFKPMDFDSAINFALYIAIPLLLALMLLPAFVRLMGKRVENG